MASSKYEITDEVNEQLIALHETDQRKWRETVADAMRNNPSQFKIMDFGMQDDGDNLLTKEEFLSHFKGGYNDEMNELLWNAMDKTDTDQVKFMEIHRFVNKVKKPSKTPRRTSIHDANWLFEKLKKMQFVSLDTDQGGTIDRKEFHEQFAQSEVDDKVLDLVFDDIDANGDGDISVMEFTKWQHNFTKKKLSKWKTIPVVATMPSIDDNKEVEKVEIPDNNDDGTDNKTDEQKDDYTEPPKDPEPEPEPEPEPQPEPDPEPAAADYAAPVEDDKPADDYTEPPVVDDKPEDKPEEIPVENEQNTTTTDNNDYTDNNENENEKDKLAVENEYDHEPHNSTDIALAFDALDAEHDSEDEANKEPSVEEAGKPDPKPEAQEAQQAPQEAAEEPPQEPVQEAPQETPNQGEGGRAPINLSDSQNGRIWVRSDKTGKWRECTIADENSNDVKIHYISYHPKYDEWISRRSSRLAIDRPAQTLDVSDNLSVYSHDLKAWVEAEVTEINEDKNEVKVSYVGVPRDEWMSNSDPRLSVVHKEPDDPYNGPTLEPAQAKGGESGGKPNANTSQPGGPESDGDQTEEMRNAQQGSSGCCCIVM